MRDYILFIDTETTGIPTNWEAPYADDQSWPHSVQIAWVLYTKEGQEVKSENHYVYEPNLKVSEASQKIHGITPEFLKANGEDRKHVLSLLSRDLEQYQPLVVGHFMQLDFHMLGAGFHRANLPNPLLDLPTFCTMDATASFHLPPGKRFLRLGQLYERLFHKPLEEQHDAAADALATAACFFKLLKQGDITEETIQQQKRITPDQQPYTQSKKYLFILLVIVVLAALLIYLL